ncbi:MAG: VWA domain-containing protein, partial [Opitutales bacterium]|nr:VWA domain-containing protein [Opitutales bacterium]
MIFRDYVWLYAGVFALVAFFALFAESQRRRKIALQTFAAKNLLKTLCYNYSSAAQKLKYALILLSIAFVFIALARPQWGYKWQETKTKGIDVVFAVDCSKSMLADDIKPDRLQRAKLAIEDAVAKLGGDRIGLVAFSGQAFLQCPLTLDYDAFKMSLDELKIGIIQRGGTNISAAIEEAEAAFKESSNYKSIILLSDGEELEENALATAKRLAKKGVVIYTIGVGLNDLSPISITDERGKSDYIRDEQGNIVKSRLDEKTLMQIAQATNGFYASLTDNGIEKAVSHLKEIPKSELESKMRQTAIDRFQIFLAIALVLLSLESLIGTRKLFAKLSRR